MSKHLEEENAATQFANALLQIEPEKIEGGSKMRQDWMELMMDIMTYLLNYDLDAETFRDMVIEGSLVQ